MLQSQGILKCHYWSVNLVLWDYGKRIKERIEFILVPGIFFNVLFLWKQKTKDFFPLFYSNLRFQNCFSITLTNVISQILNHEKNTARDKTKISTSLYIYKKIIEKKLGSLSFTQRKITDFRFTIIHSVKRSY